VGARAQRALFANPQVQLRAGDGWQPIYEQLVIDWLDRGCSSDGAHRPRPAKAIRSLREALERSAPMGPEAEDPGGEQDLFC
jgi:hypothetical protein